MSKKIVQNPRKKQGEGELMFEVRYAEADCHTGYEKEAIENLCGAIKEAKADFPKLQPITVYPTTLPEETGDITTDILNCYLRRERVFAEQQRQAEANIVEYVKAIQTWREKWVGGV